ncbi:MAG: OstA-like protein [Rikenellaceae bacterium]
MRKLFSILLVVVLGGMIFARGTTANESPQQESPQKQLIDIKADLVFSHKVNDTLSVLCFVGDFAAQHNGAIITADSAVRYDDKRIVCFGNVLINKNTTYAYADSAEYDGNLNEASLYAPIVKVVDEDVTLYSYNFKFNTLDNYGWYWDGGITLNEESLLSSKYGYYYSDEKELICVEGVEIRGEGYEMKGDSVIYNLETNYADYFERTNIWSDEGDYLYADRGSYDREQQLHLITLNGYLLTDEQEAWSDSLDYYRENEHAILRSNIQLDDTTHKALAFGDYGELWGVEDNILLTRRAKLVSYDLEQSDSLFLKADTIELISHNSAWERREAVRMEREAFVRDSLAKERLLDSLRAVFVADSIHKVFVADSLRAVFVADSLHQIFVADSLHQIFVADSLRQVFVADSLRDVFVADSIKKRYVADSIAAVKATEAKEAASVVAPKPAPAPTPAPAQQPKSIVTTEGARAARPEPSVATEAKPDVKPDVKPTPKQVEVAPKEDKPEVELQKQEEIVVQEELPQPDSLSLVSLALDTLLLDSLTLDSIALSRTWWGRMKYKYKVWRRERDAEMVVKDSIREQERLAKIYQDQIELKEIAQARQAKINEKLDAEEARLARIAIARKIRYVERENKRRARRGEELLVLDTAGMSVVRRDSSDVDSHDHSHEHEHDHGVKLPVIDSLLQDSLAQDLIEEDSIYRHIKAYRNVRTYRDDFQSVSDSMVMVTSDTTLHLYLSPAVWNGSSQITSDIMDVYTFGGELERIEFIGKPIMASKIDTIFYNQVTGKIMTSYFRDNEVYQNDVESNVETIYFQQEEESDEIETLVVVESGSASFYIKNNELDGITYRSNPVYNFYPLDKIPEGQSIYLKGFVWREDERPTRESIFNHTQRSSEREQRAAIPKPKFPIESKILESMERYKSRKLWRDRNEVVSFVNEEWMRSLGYTTGEKREDNPLK